MVLSLITAKRKDRHSFGCCLCNPWISCLSEAIQIQLYPIVFAKRLICQSVGVFGKKLIVIYSFERMSVFRQGTLIWQRYTNVSCLRTYLREKRRDSYDPQLVNLLGEDSICMVNLLVIPQKIVVVFCYMIDLLRLFQNRSFVLSSEHENQNVATIGTLLDQLMLSCK